jgi:hypothetical protein
VGRARFCGGPWHDRSGLGDCSGCRLRQGGLGRSKLIAAPPRAEVPLRSTTWFPSSRYCRSALLLRAHSADFISRRKTVSSGISVMPCEW